MLSTPWATGRSVLARRTSGTERRWCWCTLTNGTRSFSCSFRTWYIIFLLSRGSSSLRHKSLNLIGVRLPRIRFIINFAGLTKAYFVICKVDERVLIIHFVVLGRSWVGEWNVMTTVIITEVNHTDVSMGLSRQSLLRILRLPHLLAFVTLWQNQYFQSWF